MGYTGEQKRQYQREWRARRRRAWLDANGPCADCGSWDQLEVDHVDPAQKVTHNVWSWSAPRREAELAKCVVRCHDCHVRKSKAGREHARDGERNGRAKLTEAQVREIRSSEAGATQLAQVYGVHRSAIRKVRLGERWHSS